MASRSIPNLFEITCGRSSTGILAPGMAEARMGNQQRQEIEDDGLGCFRGLAVVMVFNVALVLLAASVWELWRHWR